MKFITMTNPLPEANKMIRNRRIRDLMSLKLNSISFT